ncbi:MAG: tRNA (adenosine(37)-N6)-threonylcarbamoyltransferase complex ATPase subunit type 1 TsaE [Bacillota bacterium]|nr:tRNA (adenosine(37)-N6)-threonylcarbamoyltransferase complex ATPase subunit type 1 TsaE [Bacillota bacterium]
MHPETQVFKAPSYTVEGLALFLYQCIRERGELPIIAMTGDLGAGKTTLSQHLCALFGVEDVVSPTFAIWNLYEGTEGTIHHFDLYRIDEEQELDEVGFFDAISSGELVLIEWANRFPHLIPNDAWWVHLGFDDHGERYAEVKR